MYPHNYGIILNIGVLNFLKGEYTTAIENFTILLKKENMLSLDNRFPLIQNILIAELAWENYIQILSYKDYGWP